MRFARAYWEAFKATPRAIRISIESAEKSTRECDERAAKKVRA